jgi:hypothetical protein
MKKEDVIRCAHLEFFYKYFHKMSEQSGESGNEALPSSSPEIHFVFCLFL